LLIDLLLALLFVTALAWAVAVFHLQGPDLSAFDRPTGERLSGGAGPSPELKQVLAQLAGLRDALDATPLRQRKDRLRQLIDEAFLDRPFDASFTPVDCGGVAGEWVIAPGADLSRRTLYIHGGAFMVGSPKSHRTLTGRFSALSGGAVLAIDYRLMPEHRRMVGIADCRTAYRWMLDHGPDGAAPVRAVFVAGDSAGGNLTLSLIAWVRDQVLRAPDAAVALSPATDSTFGSPSLKANRPTDLMLGPILGGLTRVPRALLLWVSWLHMRINPRDPMVSPVYGDLSRLPPVLVHASEVEMLFDDCRRYVNRAQAAGSPVRLQTWNHMLHVWQIFNPELPEAQHALAEIGKFLAAVAPLPQSSNASELVH
jgi:acetyl esterase/lipase